MNQEILQKIQQKASNCGFEEFGVTNFNDFDFYTKHLNSFIKKKYYGEMAWLKEKAQARKNPKNMWKEAKSALVFALNYGPEKNPLPGLKEKNKAYISIYARRKDYHKIIKAKLKEIARYIKTVSPVDVKVFVDTAPLMEKPLAELANLGWIGKHTNLVSRNFGSWLFLGIILIDKELNNEGTKNQNCGSCKACIDICPTNAIVEPYKLDARKCISYLTIEHKSNIEEKYRKLIGNRIFGCDDCLSICPWNKFAKKYRESKFEYINKLDLPKLKTLTTFTEMQYHNYFSGTALKRLGYNRFKRNLLIAVGNSKDISMIKFVLENLNNENEMVRCMAVWALKMLNKKFFLSEKKKRYRFEKSIAIKQEWDNNSL